ncbi:MAG: hypothetical protein IJV91_13450 [Kiritimatiellae bacterium]|nr:hypothetical protein [Kiritimatiellia bacterium]
MQMLINFASHNPYRERPAHEKGNAKCIEKHNLASSASTAQLIAERMWHMTYCTAMFVRLAPKFSAVFLGVEPHNVLLEPLKELRSAFGESHRLVRALGKNDPFPQNVPLYCFVHVEKDIKSPLRSQ